MHSTSLQPQQPNHFLYNLASAICDPMSSNANPLLQHTITRLAISIITLLSTYGIGNILASVYVDIQDQKLLDAAVARHNPIPVLTSAFCA